MFQRKQQTNHDVHGNKIAVSYDRITTRFTLSCQEEVLFSKLLVGLPIRRAHLKISNESYQLRIFWFLFWSSSLKQNGEEIIAELLPSRKRKSIGKIIYAGLANLVRALS